MHNYKVVFIVFHADNTSCNNLLSYFFTIWLVISRVQMQLSISSKYLGEAITGAQDPTCDQYKKSKRGNLN